MQYDVQYSIGDKVKYITSDRVMVVMGYEILGSYVRYMTLDNEGRGNTCNPIELESVGDVNPIGFTIKKQ